MRFVSFWFYLRSFLQDLWTIGGYGQIICSSLPSISNTSRRSSCRDPNFSALLNLSSIIGMRQYEWNRLDVEEQLIVLPIGHNCLGCVFFFPFLSFLPICNLYREIYELREVMDKYYHLLYPELSIFIEGVYSEILLLRSARFMFCYWITGIIGLQVTNRTG